MSNVYGAGAPAAGLNAPGGMPPWLMNMWNYVNPMAQATAGGVDAQGRPQDAITAAQQALATQALNGGPQASGPIARSQAANVSTPTLGGNSLYPQNVINAVNSGGSHPVFGPQVGQSAAGATNIPTNATLTAPRPRVAGIGDYPQSAGGYAPKPPMPTAWPASSTPTGMPAPAGTPSATPRPVAGGNVTVKPRAAAAPVVPQVPWITSQYDRQNLPAGNGPLGRNAQRQMGMLDLSKLFNRAG